ncbi:MAG TPA: hypothetical protein VFZ02_04425 [Ktedonobacteraceae bacterium]
MLKKSGTGLATVGIITAAATGAYLLLVGPWQRRWGATNEEVQRALPGDEEVEHPLMNATRAITINARPEEIWPWLVQIGTGRAGWYSYDWIENSMGLEFSSANRIIPEFQDLEVGDTVPLAPGLEMPVKVLKPNESLLLVGHDPVIGDTSWSFGLCPLDKERTRLVTRTRVRWPITPGGILWLFVTEPGSFLMVRKMLLGIKRRVEQAGAQSPKYIAV